MSAVPPSYRHLIKFAYPDRPRCVVLNLKCLWEVTFLYGLQNQLSSWAVWNPIRCGISRGVIVAQFNMYVIPMKMIV